METRVKPELVLKRKVCQTCGEKKFELIPVNLDKYVCFDCLT